MDLLLLLYTLSFIPIKADKYTEAANRARDAVMIQSGAKHQFDYTRNSLDNYAKKHDVFVPIAAAAWVYKGYREKTWQVRTRWGSIGASNNAITYGLSVAF